MLNFQQVQLEKSDDFLIHILISSIDEIPDSLFQWVCNSNSTLATEAALSLLSDRVVIGQKSDVKRNQLYSKRLNLENLRFSQFNLNAISRVWMYCSYSTNIDKHKIKIDLNLWIKNYGEKLGLHDSSQLKEKKLRNGLKVVIVSEVLTNDHAMWRAYKTILEQLNLNMDVTLLYRAKDVSTEILAKFNKTIEFTGIKDAFAIIKKINPDIIYYPSIGMRTFSIVLANFRLACTQVMTLGHPATSKSKSIDFVLLQETFRANNKQKEFIEEVLYDNKKITDAYYLNSKGICKKSSLNIDGDINIAIIGKSFKLNSKFIKFLKVLKEKINKKIIFHFFPNEAGLFYYQIKYKIENEIAGAIVHSMSNYENYTKKLSKCDLAVGSFPFGQTSGIFDCLSVGIPLFELYGEEIHECIGALIYSELGMSHYLSADKEELLIDLIFNYVIDKNVRLKFEKDLINIRRILSESEKNEVTTGTEFVELMEKCHNNMVIK